MQHLEVSCAVQPIEWPLGVKWLISLFCFGRSLQVVPVVCLWLGGILTLFFSGAIELLDKLKPIIYVIISKISYVIDNNVSCGLDELWFPHSQLYIPLYKGKIYLITYHEGNLIN